MEEKDLLYFTIPDYVLGSSFCSQNLWNGGTCIFVHKDLCFSKINISRNSKEKDLEICAIELDTNSYKLIILSLYRAPRADCRQFIKYLVILRNIFINQKQNF
jgi:hypothetical protein